MSVSFCLSHTVAMSAFIICRGLCAFTKIFCMGVLYVSLFEFSRQIFLSPFTNE